MTVQDPVSSTSVGSDRVRQVLSHYDEPLLREVARRLVNARSVLPLNELIDRAIAALHNTPLLDRRLRELPASARQLLALIGRSRQSEWHTGPLVGLLAALGHAEGLTPFLTLMTEGLLYPNLTPGTPPLRQFESYFGMTAATGAALFVLPNVAHRARQISLDLPNLPAASPAFGEPIREADGLDWPLKLAAVRQMVELTPIRRTQNHDFFKRDLQRLRGDAVLSAPAVDSIRECPDGALLAVSLAEQVGLLVESDGELHAASFSPAWTEGLPAVLSAIWSGWHRIQSWNPVDGWTGPRDSDTPFTAAGFLALLLLAQQNESAWVDISVLGQWVLDRHPFWQGRAKGAEDWAATFLLGLAHSWRLIQASRDEQKNWLVRLSPLGRWLLADGPLPTLVNEYRQTLLVQPNFEILLYRQGLTTSLTATLSRFATWKSIGPACQLELSADRVYRGLEQGLTLDTLLRTLQQHGLRPTPEPVVEALRSWANKRERIVVYPKATLVEFASPEDLTEALTRGLVEVKLTDYLALVSDESRMPYRHFRLTGTRDYAAPPEQCVSVEADGLTLTVDPAKSDLLLESELARLAEPLPPVNGRRRSWRLTQTTLRQVLKTTALALLDEWFLMRTGAPLSPAGRLLAVTETQPPANLRSLRVLQVATEELADGLQQWPATRELIVERLGPKALAVDAAQIDVFRQRLAEIGWRCDGR